MPEAPRTTAGTPYRGTVELEVTGEVVEWRGPPPHHFVVLPEQAAARVRAVAGVASYGWGCIPVDGRIGDSTFTTSLFPKDGGYYLPIKAAVRHREGVELGDVVTVVVDVSV